MGILSRLFGGSSARPVPIMTAASQGALPSSGGDDGGHGQWRSLGPMPVAVSRFRPVVQTARFESSLTTRSQPTTLAPLVHNRSAQYLSGVVEGIAVALPAVRAIRPPATHPPADAAPRVGVVQRFTRPWYRFTGGDGGTPNPVADATPDPVPAVANAGTEDQTDEPGLSQQFLPPQPPETAGLALPEEPATVDHSLPLVVAQNQAPVGQRAPAAMSRPKTQEALHRPAVGPQDIGLAPPVRPAVGTDLPVPVLVEGSSELPGLPTVVPALDEPPRTLPPGPQTLTQSEHEASAAGPSLDREPIWSQTSRPSSRDGPCVARANRRTFQARRAGRAVQRAQVGPQ